jgi:hypothetical protein
MTLQITVRHTATHPYGNPSTNIVQHVCYMDLPPVLTRPALSEILQRYAAPKFIFKCVVHTQQKPSLYKILQNVLVISLWFFNTQMRIILELLML